MSIEALMKAGRRIPRNVKKNTLLMYLKTTKMTIENQIRIEETLANPMLTITSTPKEQSSENVPQN